MVRPGETSSEILSARIAALEAMVDNLMDQNKVILDAVEDLKKKQNTPLTYANRAGGNAASGQGGGQRQQQVQPRGRDVGQGQLKVPGNIRERSNSNNRPRFSSDNEERELGSKDRDT